VKFKIPLKTTSVDVGLLEDRGIRATKGRAQWINEDSVMKNALLRFEEEVYKKLRKENDLQP